MIIPSFRFLSKRVNSLACLVIIAGLLFGRNASVHAMDSARGGPLPQSPLFPPDNWWNLDISSWPVDPNSSSYIAFINNGGTRRLHPDFGGNAGTAQDPKRDLRFSLCDCFKHHQCRPSIGAICLYR